MQSPLVASSPPPPLYCFQTHMHQKWAWIFNNCYMIGQLELKHQWRRCFMEMMAHPLAFPHTFSEEHRRCTSARTPLLPFPPPRTCLILYFCSYVTDCSLFFPPFLSLRDCIHVGHCSFLTPPGCEPVSSRSCYSSVLVV